MRHTAAVSFLAASFVLLTAVPALAHSEPVVIIPAECSTVSSADEIVMDLTTEADADESRLVASVDGVVIATAEVDLSDIDRQRMVVSLPSNVTGRVDVEWTTKSAVDGEIASGSYAFGIGPDSDLTNCELQVAAEGTSSVSLSIIGLIAGAALVGFAVVHNRRQSVAVPS